MLPNRKAKMGSIILLVLLYFSVADGFFDTLSIRTNRQFRTCDLTRRDIKDSKRSQEDQFRQLNRVRSCDDRRLDSSNTWNDFHNFAKSETIQNLDRNNNVISRRRISPDRFSGLTKEYISDQERNTITRRQINRAREEFVQQKLRLIRDHRRTSSIESTSSELVTIDRDFARRNNVFERRINIRNPNVRQNSHDNRNECGSRISRKTDIFERNNPDSAFHRNSYENRQDSTNLSNIRRTLTNRSNRVIREAPKVRSRFSRVAACASKNVLINNEYQNEIPGSESFVRRNRIVRSSDESTYEPYNENEESNLILSREVNRRTLGPTRNQVKSIENKRYLRLSVSLPSKIRSRFEANRVYLTSYRNKQSSERLKLEDLSAQYLDKSNRKIQSRITRRTLNLHGNAFQRINSVERKQTLQPLLVSEREEIITSRITQNRKNSNDRRKSIDKLKSEEFERSIDKNQKLRTSFIEEIVPIRSFSERKSRLSKNSIEGRRASQSSSAGSSRRFIHTRRNKTHVNSRIAKDRSYSEVRTNSLSRRESFEKITPVSRQQVKHDERLLENRRLLSTIHNNDPSTNRLTEDKKSKVFKEYERSVLNGSDNFSKRSGQQFSSTQRKKSIERNTNKRLISDSRDGLNTRGTKNKYLIEDRIIERIQLRRKEGILFGNEKSRTLTDNNHIRVLFKDKPDYQESLAWLNIAKLLLLCISIAQIFSKNNSKILRFNRLSDFLGANKEKVL